MKVATLIVNPAAGSAGRPKARMPAIEALLAEHGYAAALSLLVRGPRRLNWSWPVCPLQLPTRCFA